MTSILKGIFGDGPKLKLIQFLYLRSPREQALSSRALAREARVPYGSIHRALLGLVASQLVLREETPDGPRFRAPLDDPRLAGLVMLIRQDSDIVRRLHRALKPFKTIEYAGIVGSFAAETTRRGSDIDLLIVDTDPSKRFEIMTSVAKVASSVHREVDTQFYAQEEIAELLARGEAIAVSPRWPLQIPPLMASQTPPCRTSGL